ncbi:hypothetical protein L1049_001400 [Liquidambar formosana]|uniref:PGG domain-containing protein n=1 Tax=Liquidambar formosana TaxID=63359 RepID=A0AAP0R638_LIQFO
MLISSSTVFIYTFLAMPMAKEKLYSYFRLAAWLTILATGAMVVAFMTGLYAVLQRSSPMLAIAICVIACSFFFFYYSLLLKPFATSSRLRHRFLRKPLVRFVHRITRLLSN